MLTLVPWAVKKMKICRLYLKHICLLKGSGVNLDNLSRGWPHHRVGSDPHRYGDLHEEDHSGVKVIKPFFFVADALN